VIRLIRKANYLIPAVIISLFAMGRSEAIEIESSFQYLSPQPGAILISKETNIIIRPGKQLSDYSIDLLSPVSLYGSASGFHTYQVNIADDRKTLIIEPLDSFEPGEIVTVDIGNFKYAFTISPTAAGLLNKSQLDSIMFGELYSGSKSTTGESHKAVSLSRNGVSLPSDFPDVTINALNNPDSGYIFLNGAGYSVTPYIMIFDNSGDPVFYKRVAPAAYDFKKQPNGLLTYYGLAYRHHYIMDSNYTIIDSVQCGNGYESGTDMHEFQILDNGHMLLMAYDPQIIDMSEIIEGGDTAATVIGLIIQELDTLKNVVFQWRSWDHFQITDAAWDVNLRAYTIDYVHGNTIEPDNDGNLLISSRNMNEITKINRQTGDIIWRCGGENNQFSFLNDSLDFIHQHDIRRLPDGRITLYDNGGLFSQRPSRAVEYLLDEANMTATLMWDFVNNPPLYGFAMGNVQRLPNGNTIIGWGTAYPNVTEVQPGGSKAFELTLQTRYFSYRAFRFPWCGVALRPYLLAETEGGIIHLIFNKFGDTTVAKYYIYLGDEPEPTVVFDSTANPYKDLNEFPYYPVYYIRVTAIDNSGVESPFSNEVEIAGVIRYVAGDINGDGNIRNSDVTYGINYFTSAGSPPPDSFWVNVLEKWLYAAADANGDCRFLGSDITYMLQYFLGNNREIFYCPQIPPFD
jgi:hypothetical protein